MPDTKSYYELLNIEKEANLNEIKLAYKKKAKELHPDKNKDTDTTKEFQELNEAYEILNNDVKRKTYDRNSSPETNFTFSSEKYDYSEHQTYSTNVNTFNCDCEDWVKNRSKYKAYDPRRLCKHLVAKLFLTDIPEEFKPFKDYLEYRYSTFRGVKLFHEIIFLKSSIIVVDYYGTHLYLYLKKQKDEFCSYQVFEVHKYKGVGYKWMEIPDSLNDSDILYKDNIDGKDYINKRFNVINSDLPLCDRLYKRYLIEEEWKIIRNYKVKYETTSELLKQVTSNYTTRSFNIKLQSMGYIIKLKNLNNNNWIIKSNGLNYGINYAIDSILSDNEVPNWYISSFFNKSKMSFEHTTQVIKVNKTNVMWEKKKFNELLEIMDSYKIDIEKKKSQKQTIREEWLTNISCHNCGSKNIHKKDKRQRKDFQVQRYQCMDCKSIFQEKIEEISTEVENIELSNDIIENSVDCFDSHNDIEPTVSIFGKIKNFFNSDVKGKQ